MRLLTLILCAAGALLADSPFFCNLKALTSPQRQQYARLNRQLAGAVIEHRELSDGYAFRISADRLSPVAVAQWIALEQKCCPFFGFELRMMAERGPVWLHLTGRSGVKDFIRQEFKLPK